MITVNRNKIYNYNEPNLQLSISTNKPDHMAELLEAIIRWQNILKDHLNITNLNMMTIANPPPA